MVTVHFGYVLEDDHRVWYVMDNKDALPPEIHNYRTKDYESDADFVFNILCIVLVIGEPAHVEIAGETWDNPALKALAQARTT